VTKQGPNNFCSAGGTLFFSDVHYFKFKAGLGSGTNNSAELLALRCLLKLANENRIERMQAFGDSLLVINRMRVVSQLQNMTLRPLTDHLKEVANLFDSISFTHKYIMN
jgi:ribonuclease HI